MRGPFEIWTVGHPDCQVMVGCGPDIFGLTDITDAPIPLGVGLANLLRAVGRGVVRDQEVEIAIALREDRVDGGREIVVTVVDW
jgi:hypothetical protein